MSEQDNRTQEDLEFDEMVRSLRPKYGKLKMAAAILLIVGVTVGCFAVMLYFLGEANKVIKDTVEKYYPVPEEPAKQVPAVTPDKSKEPGDSQAPAAEPGAQANPLLVTKFDLTVPNGLPPAIAAAAARIRPVMIAFEEGPTHFGTGSLINGRLLLTCNHLFGSSSPEYGNGRAQLQTLCQPDKPISIGNFVARGRDTDSVLAVVDCPKSEALVYRQTAMPDNGKVWMVGLNFDIANKKANLYVKRTTVNRRISLLKQMKALLKSEGITEQQAASTYRWLNNLGDPESGLKPPVGLNCRAIPGNSGSLVLDSKGRVAGLLFAGDQLPNSFYMPSHNLRMFSDKALPMLNKAIRQEQLRNETMKRIINPDH